MGGRWRAGARAALPGSEDVSNTTRSKPRPQNLQYDVVGSWSHRPDTLITEDELRGEDGEEGLEQAAQHGGGR